MGSLSRQNIERLPKPERVARTDLGIAIAHAVSPAHKQWTLDEIAIFCGCTESAILLIEQKALRRLRKRMVGDPHLRELVMNLCQ